MVSTKTEDEFAALPAEGKGILRGRPNHILINGDLLLMARCAPTLKSKSFTMEIINFLRITRHDGGDEDNDTDDEGMIKAKEAAAGSETLLAMLWASENGGLTPIHLQDVPDNGSLNQIIRNVKSKLTAGVQNGPALASTDGGTTAKDATEAAAWAVSSQSIVQEINRMHESRKADRAQKESNMSLLKTLNPSQKLLFKSLCKIDFESDPVMSPFYDRSNHDLIPPKRHRST